jgi:hypothetical protein
VTNGTSTEPAITFRCSPFPASWALTACLAKAGYHTHGHLRCIGYSALSKRQQTQRRAMRSAGAGARTYAPRMRDIEVIDSELRSVAALRRAARERGRPLPSIDAADALLDQRREQNE